MTKNKVEILKMPSLSKEIYFRKTVKNDYLLYSVGSELLVFDEYTWNTSIISSLRNVSVNSSLFNLLKENRFFESNHCLPEYSKKYLKILRVLWLVMGVVSVVISIAHINNVQNFSYNINNDNLLFLLLFGVIFSIVTTVLHEFVHLIFSNSFTHRNKVVHFSLEKSIATVDLTHVWLWPTFSRMMAVLAGLILDSTILTCLFVISGSYSNPFLTVAILILTIRVLWQFRINQHTDGHLLVLMLLDNPFLKIDFESDGHSLSSVEKRIWGICRFFSFVITIIISLITIFFILKVTRYL